MDRLKAALGTMGLQPNFSQLEAYHKALYEANAVMNLTRVPEAEAWTRHYLDSLLFQDLIPQGSRVLDIGTGPGFPSWIIAWARPDLRVVSLDSNGKMLGFLRSQPLGNLSVVEARAEDWGETEKFDVVTGRALAPLPVQLELSARPCKLGGLVIPMRTANDAAEIDRLDEILGMKLGEVVKRTLGEDQAERWFPVWTKLYKTPREFPRNWGEMRRNPL